MSPKKMSKRANRMDSSTCRGICSVLMVPQWTFMAGQNKKMLPDIKQFCVSLGKVIINGYYIMNPMFYLDKWQ